MKHKPAVLFVCLGNICRSPLAEAAFRLAADRAGLEVIADSAGTSSYHLGAPPDRRSIAVAARHGVDIRHYQGRQINHADFTRFTHILALDESNLSDVLRIAPRENTAKIMLLMDTLPDHEGHPVADPYYGDKADFEVTWDDVSRAAEALVRSFKQSDST